MTTASAVWLARAAALQLGLLVLVVGAGAGAGAGAGVATIGCVGDSITQGVGASCPPCVYPPGDYPRLQACGPHGCNRSWPGQLQQILGAGSSFVWNWGHVAATMQSTTNCNKSTACGGRMCGGKPCKSNGPPYWATREFAVCPTRVPNPCCFGCSGDKHITLSSSAPRLCRTASPACWSAW